MSGNFKCYNYLSESDLQLLDFWTEDYPVKHAKAWNDFLFKHGAEVSQGVEVMHDTHRTLQNKVYTGRRWLFVERVDKEWIRSGYASMEAYVAASDKETQRDMANMSRRYQLPEKKGVEE